ncbi:hypothetical protein BFF78_19375 [Streptomyces fodineus]|uniref:Major facilitator superfamily (MFS) profile domain-containing protein n=2 Tax=Streptomyces fodineus TaxID=1904616 RepID=A0A1D7YNT8_9ACTN|nr:hypothetical protein BFF78_19375 [Streptomyces fodineus]
MAQLDGALVNIGLATITADLHTTLRTAQWIVSAYLLALVMGLPLCGWATRRIGASRLWLWSLGAFTVASLLCAVAPSIEALIVFRAVQGIAGGLLLPVGQTVIVQVAGRELIGRVMSAAGAALVLAPALGPIAGGLLIAHISWPWLFLVNLPVGALGLWLGLRLLPRDTPRAAADGQRFDTGGFALIGVGLPAVTWAISQAGQPDTRTFASCYAPLAVGALLLAVFAVRSLRAGGRPLLNLGLFRGPVFAAASASSFCAGAVQYGALVIWALYFQAVRGYGVIDSGLAMLAFAVGAALVPLSGRLAERFGGGPVALAGALLTVAAAVPPALLDDRAPLAALQVCLFVLGVANALSVVPPSTAAYVSINPAEMPDAVTVINIFLRLGGAVGSALLVAVLGGLTGGAASFRPAFWCLAALGAVFAAAALVLTRAASPQPATRK